MRSSLRHPEPRDVFGREEKGLRSSAIRGISSPSSGAARLATQGTHCRVDQGEAGKHGNVISIDGDCTEEPKL